MRLEILLSYIVVFCMLAAMAGILDNLYLSEFDLSTDVPSNYLFGQCVVYTGERHVWLVFLVVGQLTSPTPFKPIS